MPKQTLKREIGLFGLSANIINIVIGAGIFVLPAIVAAGLGHATIVAYVFCAVLIMLNMLCMAEVGSHVTNTGGVYTYIETTFGKYPGFLAAVLFLFSNITGTSAVANAVIDIILKVFPGVFFIGIKPVFFLVLFGGLAYINIIGLKKGVGLVKLITILKLGPLFILVIAGFKYLTLSNLYWDTFPSFHQLGATSLVLFFAFTGAGSALSVSGEVKNPQTTIPRAVLLSIVSVTIIYILIQTVAQGVLGPELANMKENVLGEVASKIIGPIGLTLLIIGAGVSMFGNISSKVLSTPRVLFAAADDMVIPIKNLASIHPKYTTPHIAIIAYAGLCFFFALTGGFEQLAIISSASSLLISIGIALAVIKLRRTTTPKSNAKTFKIPGGYTVPILAIISILWFLSNLSVNKIIAVAVSIAILTAIYFVMKAILKKR